MIVGRALAALGSSGGGVTGSQKYGRIWAFGVGRTVNGKTLPSDGLSAASTGEGGELYYELSRQILKRPCLMRGKWKRSTLTSGVAAG